MNTTVQKKTPQKGNTNFVFLIKTFRRHSLMATYTAKHEWGTLSFQQSQTPFC